LKSACGEFTGFVEFIEFVEFVGFKRFVEFIEFVEFVGFVEFVEFVVIGMRSSRALGGQSSEERQYGRPLTESASLYMIRVNG